MASVVREKNGGIQIQFYLEDKRRSVRLGKTADKVVARVKAQIEQIVAARKAGVAIDVESTRWLDGIDDKLHAKLAKTTLVAPREIKAVITLGAFVAEYVTKRQDVKTASKTVWRQGERSLLKHFGAERPVVSIRQGDAEDYKQWLLSEKVREGKTAKRGKLAPYTARKRLQFAKMIFAALVKRGVITTNPFHGVQVAAVMDEARNVFVARDDIAKVLEACPDAEWRLIVSLSRYGGLRCPSETLSLKWEHIDWAKRRITVISPKTAHHPGGGQRIIPLFDDLATALSEAHEQAPEGAVFVISRNRSQADATRDWRNTNLRTRFEKIVDRAGLNAWPRLFHALRASCETELVERFPVQTVTAWLGNSPKVALKHYLRVLPEHFDRASEKAGRKAGLLETVKSGTATNPKSDIHSGIADSTPYDQRPNQRRMGWDSNPRYDCS